MVLHQNQTVLEVRFFLLASGKQIFDKLKRRRKLYTKYIQNILVFIDGKYLRELLLSYEAVMFDIEADVGGVPGPPLHPLQDFQLPQ